MSWFWILLILFVAASRAKDDSEENDAEGEKKKTD